MEPTPPMTRDHSPLKSTPRAQSRGLRHTQQTVRDWQRLQELESGMTCKLNGENLDLAEVVAVAKHGAAAYLTSEPRLRHQIHASIETLEKHLRDGHVVYGVTTGFGGSAESRTTDTASLQRALVQHQNAGVLTSTDVGHQQKSSKRLEFTDYDASFDTQSMPTTWVRASMLIRCNSIIRGHSAVRYEIAEAILTLLRHEITPVIPLRGSISASGDLSPLSYIAGALEGNADIYVRVGKGTARIVSAQKALQDAGLEPIHFRAKEGLGLLNGTAVSAGTAALALYQVQQIALLSQVLTAMATEALQGTAESFFPRIAEMRPHPGQIECADNILSFLQDSKLAMCVGVEKDTKMTGLYQDRYALRTSSQWIGPQLEDLHHAHEQLMVELNSTTDNPLIDSENDRILHGGNFQAAVVTSTMDRTRIVMERLGRMLFAQATEMINPMTNKGLPANLAADDPSLSFTCKGVDINMASYTSELGFLANPVGNHVMSAEMHNQSINSIALISSRYTFQALDTIRILCAAYIFVVCQALDLRVQQAEFMKTVESQLIDLVADTFVGSDVSANDSFNTELYIKLNEAWSTTTTLDLEQRAMKATEALIPALFAHCMKLPTESQSTALTNISNFVTKAPEIIKSSYTSTATRISKDRLSLVPRYLGTASRLLYTFVRSPVSSGGLGVPFHLGLVEHPTEPAPEGWSEEDISDRKTIGTRISVIYEALRDGEIADIVVKIVKESLVGRQ